MGARAQHCQAHRHSSRQDVRPRITCLRKGDVGFAEGCYGTKDRRPEAGDEEQGRYRRQEPGKLRRDSSGVGEVCETVTNQKGRQREPEDEQTFARPPVCEG